MLAKYTCFTVIIQLFSYTSEATNSATFTQNIAVKTVRTYAVQ